MSYNPITYSNQNSVDYAFGISLFGEPRRAPLRTPIPDSQMRTACCHFAVTRAAFNLGNLWTRCFRKPLFRDRVNCKVFIKELQALTFECYLPNRPPILNLSVISNRQRQ